MKIEGAVAVITGGARGLGKAYAVALLERGARVCVADINVDEGTSTENELKSTYGQDSVMFVKCDVRKYEDFKNLFEVVYQKFNSISIMVNNAGIVCEPQPEMTIEVNLLGVMKGTNLAIDHMRKDKGGQGGLILNIASVAGILPAFFMPAYCASKHGVVGFTRSWAANPSAKTYGIRFAVLCPAFTDTVLLSNALDESNSLLVTYKENRQGVEDMIEAFGMMSIDSVVEAFLDIVKKEENNGAVVTVDEKSKIVYRYTEHPLKL